MIKRISIISTAVLATLLIAGLAWATPDNSSSSPTTTTSTSLAAGPATGAQATTGTYDAGVAGQVTVDRSGTSLSVGNVAANAGWAPEVEMASGREVEVKFVNGNERIDFQAELEDGVVKTRVRVGVLDTSTGTSGTVGSDDSRDDSSDDSVSDRSDDSNDDSGMDDSIDSSDTDDSDDDSNDDSQMDDSSDTDDSDDDSSRSHAEDDSDDDSSGRSHDDGHDSDDDDSLDD
ncbi:MAG: hypothetical protein ACXW1Y_10650 [Acidimicrobiia bacterium]